MNGHFMVKPIAIISHDPELVKIRKEMVEIADHYSQKQEFIQKQLNDLAEDAKRVMTPTMNQLTEYLVKHNRMPKDYDPKKHHLHFDDNDVVYLCDGPI